MLPLDSGIKQAVEAIHQRSRRFVLIATGGGTSVPGLLLSVPGGSRSVLEILIPYGQEAFVELLGRQPHHFTSAATSQALADRALDRAHWLAPGELVVGVACTASLASDRPKRGEHRFHISVHTSEKGTTYSVALRKNARSREEEEAVVAAVLLNALAEAVGSNVRVAPGLLEDEPVQVETTPGDRLSALLRGEIPAICVDVDGRVTKASSSPGVVLPGAFNPAHEGHRRLAEAAARITGKPVAFELSVINVDKPPLTVEDVRRRIQAFAWHWPVWITRAPTFEEKALLFTGAIFVIGADTAERLVATRYYGDSQERMTAALRHIGQLGCRFLVAGREDRQGKFVGIEQLALPEFCRELFTGIPEGEFRVAISSTALRETAQLNGASRAP